MKPLSLSTPHVIVMVGIPGAGKSYFAEHFAETFSAPLVRLHTLESELYNSPSHDSGENAVTKRVASYVFGELLKTQRTIVYDGATDSRTDRTDIARAARAAGYNVLFIWVQTESASARARALKQSANHSAISEEQFDSRIKHFTAPHETEKAVVISGKHTYASQLKIVLKRLIDPREPVVTERTTPPTRPTGPRIILR